MAKYAANLHLYNDHNFITQFPLSLLMSSRWLKANGQMSTITESSDTRLLWIESNKLLSLTYTTGQKWVQKQQKYSDTTFLNRKLQSVIPQVTQNSMHRITEFYLAFKECNGLNITCKPKSYKSVFPNWEKHSTQNPQQQQTGLATMANSQTFWVQGNLRPWLSHGNATAHTPIRYKHYCHCWHWSSRSLVLACTDKSQ